MWPTCIHCDSESEIVEVKNSTFNNKKFVCVKCPDSYSWFNEKAVFQARPGNFEARQLRLKGHELFEPIWQAKKAKDNCSATEARSLAYIWLSDLTGIPLASCHFGLMSLDELHLTVNKLMEFKEKVRNKHVNK